MIPSDTLHLSQVTDPALCLTKWDDFVAGIKNGHVFQTAKWAAYKQKTGWQPILLSWSSQGSPRAACLVLHRSMAALPVGGVLYVPRGPVLDYDSPEARQLLAGVLDRLKQLARRRFAVARISPDVERTTTWVQGLLLERGFSPAKQPVGHTATIRLDLTQPLDHIICGIQAQRRRKVRQYEKEHGGWYCYCDDSSRCLETFYSMYHETLTGAGKCPKCLDEVRCMHETLAPYGSSSVFIVKYQDRPVAGGIVIALGERLWYLYSGSVKGDGRVSGAGMVLQWEMIKWAKKQGYAEFDLMGIPESPEPDHPLYGVYCFKRRWGGEEVYLAGEYNYAPYPFLESALEWRLAH